MMKYFAFITRSGFLRIRSVPQFDICPDFDSWEALCAYLAAGGAVIAWGWTEARR